MNSTNELRQRLSLAFLIFLALIGLSCGPGDSGPATVTETDGNEPEPAAATEEGVVPDLGPRLADHEPSQLFDDLTDVRTAGALRVLVHRQDLKGMHRPGAAGEEEITLVSMFADSLDLPIRFVVVPTRDRLIPALLEGRGDLIADRLSVTARRADQVVFSTPLRHVDEVVVGAKGSEALPGKIQDLLAADAPSVHLRRSSSFVERLEKAAAKAKIQDAVLWQPLPEHLGAAQILDKVALGEVPLTVQDSDAVAAHLKVRSDLEIAFVLEKRVPIVWAVRPTSERLIEAANGFLLRGDLEARREDLYGGDLEAVKRRGVLRVMMPSNASSFFLYRGQPMGFQLEMARRLSDSLGVRLDAVAPASQARMLRELERGRVDVIAAVLAVTPERERRASFSPPLLEVDEVLVQKAGEPPLTDVAELAGRAIHARPSSSYWQTLQELAASVDGLEVVAADESLETEELIDAVARGGIPLTVSDSNILERVRTHRDDIQGSLVLASGKPLAFAVRKDAPELLAAVARFVEATTGSSTYEKLYRKYFQEERSIRKAELHALKRGQLSPYDDLARKYARQYGLDWRMLVAQMYQESGFDPKAKSWAGALGLMQVMPATAREMGVEPEGLYQPEIAIAAGAEYMSRMLRRFDPSLPTVEGWHFALASYNAGYGHVLDARALAPSIDKHGNVWLQNVDQSIVLLEDPEVWQRARYGYCRGSEPQTYVRNIQGFYDAYRAWVPAEGIERTSP